MVARVNGDLAVSRGFGDADYKKTGGPGPEDRPVTADPELGEFYCEEADFLLLVCDGVSEGSQDGVCLFPNADVVKLVAKQLEETGGDPGAAARAVCHRALLTQSKDNVTCMVVMLTGKGDEETAETEFIPGAHYGLEDEKFRKAYQAMAEKAGYTLAGAVELRYENVQEKLASLDGTTDEERFQVGQLRSEQAKLGDGPTGTKGSDERKEWFENWVKEVAKEENSAYGAQSQLQGLLRDACPGGLLGPARQQTSRDVTAPELHILKEAVDNHKALKWDDRMEKMVGKRGKVVQDDADGTSNVRFQELGIVAWLPTDVLLNCDDEDPSDPAP